MNSILKTSIVASLFIIGAGSAHAALSNNGLGLNGQFNNGLGLNGKFSNGAGDNGTQTSGTVDRTVVIQTITLSNGTVLTVK